MIQIGLRKLILVIDDSRDNQQLLETLILARGDQVYCTSNGQEALCLLKELSVLPDLILLDAQMPIMDGYQFRNEQRNTPRLRDIPVVVMTADDNLELNRDMLYPAGVLRKPFSLKKFEDGISPLLQ